MRALGFERGFMTAGSRIIAWAVAALLGIATLAGWLAIPHAPRLDPLVLVVLWFTILIMLVGIGLEVARRPYSLNLLHLISMLLFLGVAAILQYSRGHFGVAG